MIQNENSKESGKDRYEVLTGDIPDQAQGFDVEAIGDRIRGIREEKGISHEEMAGLTGFDVETLAKIEANDIQPQLGTLVKLSKALDSAFSRLVSGVGSRVYSVTRNHERKPISRSTSAAGRKLYTYQSLAPEVRGRHMEALIVDLEENPDQETSVHEGEEFIFVLEGTVVVKIDKDVFELEPGDSVYYLSTTSHMVAAKKDTARILAVLYEG
ncbi:MAG: XRE family transcriptional regulator [Desulfobacteraceae bacterium]|nr:XRE family transcriptional regulator [Desulfobacteraceae bacterium]